MRHVSCGIHWTYLVSNRLRISRSSRQALNSSELWQSKMRRDNNMWVLWLRSLRIKALLQGSVRLNPVRLRLRLGASNIGQSIRRALDGRIWRMIRPNGSWSWTYKKLGCESFIVSSARLKGTKFIERVDVRERQHPQWSTSRKAW